MESGQRTHGILLGDAPVQDSGVAVGDASMGQSVVEVVGARNAVGVRNEEEEEEEEQVVVETVRVTRVVDEDEDENEIEVGIERCAHVERVNERWLIREVQGACCGYD